MAKIAIPAYESPLDIVPWKDSQGRSWILEEGDCQSLEEQKAIKEKIPFQDSAASERTVKQVNGICEKLARSKTGDEVVNLMFRTINWCTMSDFKVQTFILLLHEKEALCEGVNLDVVRLGQKALLEKGAIPNKLKAAYNLLTKGPNVKETTEE